MRLKPSTAGASCSNSSLPNIPGCPALHKHTQRERRGDIVSAASENLIAHKWAFGGVRRRSPGDGGRDDQDAVQPLGLQHLAHVLHQMDQLPVLGGEE